MASHFHGFAEGFPKPHGLDGLGVGIALGATLFNGLHLELVGLADDVLLSRGAVEVSLHCNALLGSLDVFIITDSTGFVKSQM